MPRVTVTEPWPNPWKLQVGALRPRTDGGRRSQVPRSKWLFESAAMFAHLDRSSSSSSSELPQAMRMGTLPIVAPTGGLKDTVEARLTFFA